MAQNTGSSPYTLFHKSIYLPIQGIEPTKGSALKSLTIWLKIDCQTPLVNLQKHVKYDSSFGSCEAEHRKSRLTYKVKVNIYYFVNRKSIYKFLFDGNFTVCHISHHL